MRYATPERVRSRLSYLDDLYDRVERVGYERQSELDGGGSQFDLEPPAYHEVGVDVGRDGEILFDDGRHRFCVAKVLGLESVPVRVLVRHPRWQEVRRAVADGAEPSELDVNVTRSHPDIQDVCREP